MANDGLNKVMLLGNLGTEAELRSTAGGKAVLKIRLATTESYLDSNRARQERTEWHTVIVWGARAEGLSRILNKGSRVFVEGGIRTSSYDDKDGNKRYKTEVVANNVILCGGGNRDGGQRPAPASSSGSDDFGAGFGGAPSPSEDPDFTF
jgi:single-strand DNA-binding protein